MRRRERGFTLIEVLIALAIMAVGVTAAIALFTAATALHKRALDQTAAALVADAAIAELRGDLTLAFDAGALETARAASSPEPPVLFFRKGATHAAYPDYAFDVYLAPVGTDDPDAADAFVAEVCVRWRSTGRRIPGDYRTVVLRRVTVRDLAAE